MNGNLNSSVSGVRGISGEGWAALAGVVGSVVLLLKKAWRAKEGRAEHITRSECCAATLATRERINEMHLAVLEKLEANQREVLAAFERQAERLGALEMAVARLEATLSSKLQHPSSR